MTARNFYCDRTMKGFGTNEELTASTATGGLKFFSGKTSRNNSVFKTSNEDPLHFPEMNVSKLKAAQRRTSYNVDPRLGTEKVLRVYCNRTNGFDIPMYYEDNHLTVGKDNDMFALQGIDEF